MKPEPKRIRELFVGAVGQADAGLRDAFLAEACDGDEGLLREVRVLLEAHQDAGRFLESPAAAPTITVESRPLVESPGTVIGPYKLLEQIGEGGMGVVYMAEQTHPVRRRVALKVIKPGMDSKQVVARFEAERQALAMMDHPNIAKVHDAGTTDSGRPYFVMELVRGIPITDYCDQARLAVPERLNLFVQVCQAVQHAHQKGVIHRDLKPSNVLVTLHDGVPMPKVIDFGIAKATGQSLTDKTLFTGFAQLLGTPLYMSPEQAELSGLDVDTRSDVYSLGVLLYELLTGTTPFDKETLLKATLDEVRRIIREQDPPTPSTRLGALGATLTDVSAKRGSDPRRLGKAVRGELDWVVMKALEKDRNRRYETASGLAADVRRYLADEPVQACPPSAWYRIGKLARRHRAAWTTVALVGVALLAGLTLSLWQAARATRAEWRTAAALAQARQQRGEADRKSAEAQAVVDFLITDMIGAASPERTRGRTVTVEEVLAGAARVIDGRFADQPLTEAAVRHAMGVAYGKLRREHNAERHLTRAIEIRTRRLGPEHPDTLESMMQLGQLKDLNGRYSDPRRLEDGRVLLQRVLDSRRHALGPDHPLTLETETWLAAILCDLGRLEESQALYGRLCPSWTRVRGPEAVETLGTMGGFAGLLRKRGDLDGAEAMLRRTVDGYRRLGDEHYVDTLHFIGALTDLLIARGNLGEAEVLSNEVLKGWDQLYGPDSMNSVGAITSWMDIFRLQGRFDEIRVLLNQRLARLDATPVRPDQDQRERRAFFLSLLVRWLVTHAETASIDPAACVRAVEMARHLVPPSPSGARTERTSHGVLLSLAKTCGQVAAALERAGQVQEAEAAYRESLALYETQLAGGPDQPLFQNNAAWFLATCPVPQLRDPARAVELARKAVAKQPDEASWNTLGVALYRAGDWNAAIEALEKAEALAPDKQLAFDGFFLAMARWQLGQRGEARTWYDKAVAWMEKNQPRDHELLHFRAEAAALLDLDDLPADVFARP